MEQKLPKQEGQVRRPVLQGPCAGAAAQRIGLMRAGLDDALGQGGHGGAHGARGGQAQHVSARAPRCARRTDYTNLSARVRHLLCRAVSSQEVSLQSTKL